MDEFDLHYLIKCLLGILVIEILLAGILYYFPNNICHVSFEAPKYVNYDDPKSDLPHPKLELLLTGDMEAALKQPLSSSDVVTPEKRGSHHVLVIPVGMDSDYIELNVAPEVKATQAVYDAYDIDVEISYLNQSLPIPIYMEISHDPLKIDTGTDNALFTIAVPEKRSLALDDFPSLSKLRHQLIDDGVYQADTIIFYSVAPHARGVAYDEHSIVLAQPYSNQKYYPLIHEIGHAIGLSDGYRRFYTPSVLKQGLNTELFTDYSQLTGTRREWLDSGKIQVYPTEHKCWGQRIYTTTGEQSSIMVHVYLDSSIFFNDGRVNPNLFTPLQVEHMKQYIDQKK